MSRDKAAELATKLATTRQAAPALHVQPQTMRIWASKQRGPISPVRIGRRLFWRWADIEALTNGEAAA